MAVAKRADEVLRAAQAFAAAAAQPQWLHSALTLLAGVLCVCLRGAATIEARWECIQMLVEIGEHCNDACIVEWLIPYLLNFVVPETTSATRGSAMSRYPVASDALARGVALRHLGRMWGRLVELPRSEWGLFNAYLVPACSAAPSAVAPMLRRDLFLSLPGLATAARRLSVVSIGALPETPAGRHAQAAALSEQLLSLRRVLSQIVQSRFLPEDLSTGQAGGPGGRSAAGGASKPGTASASAARAYLMQAAGELAAFLGEELAMTTLVPMFMYLPNESDWRVRAAFYHHLPEVTGTVGRSTLSKVFLPVIEATLAKRDEVPDVLVPALRAVSHLLTAGLVAPSHFLSPLRAPLPALRLLLHRATSVRGAAVALVADLAATLDVADTFALLAPALQHALGLNSPPDLNPLLFSERDVMADFVRRFVEAPQLPPPSQPSSRVEHMQAHLQSSHDRPTSGSRLIAETADPQLHSPDSLHSLALQHAAVLRPPAAADASGALRRLCNGAVCASLAPGESLVPREVTDGAGCRSAAPVAGVQPESVLSELSSRLVLQSRVTNSSLDSDGKPGGGEFDAGPRAKLVPDGLGDFAPRGVLVAHMAEHQHAVNSLAVSQSRCHWFASASSDGTIKLWGCGKEGVHIDKISCFSSLLTYSAHDGSVTDVRLLSDDASDAMHVASIDSTGQLHLWDVSVQPRKAVSQRPTLAFPPAGPSQVNLDSGHLCKLLVWGPLLLVASEAGGIRAYDPRAGGRGVWSMAVPPSHGVVTCMAAVPGAPALCSGTTRGMMHVWDMRMQLRVDSRWHPSRAAIQTMACPTAPPASLGVRSYSGSAPLVYVSSQGNEISLYDLQDFKTRQRICGWQPRRPTEPGSRQEGLAPDDIKDAKAAQLPDSRAGFRSLLPLPSGALICAGTDKCIRYLTTKDRSKSYVVCGHMKGSQGVVGGPDVKYSQRMDGDAMVFSEDVVYKGASRSTGHANTVAEDRAYRRLQAQGHRDCVNSMALAAIPSGPVLLSAGRDGIIKAWR